jgi:hypothetical protein
VRAVARAAATAAAATEVGMAAGENHWENNQAHRP